jgi:hypothetical protein
MGNGFESHRYRQSKSPEDLQFSEDLGAFVRSWGTPRDGGITGVR